MQVSEVGPGVLAFIRPDEGANAGLVRTNDGVVVVDTTSYPATMQELLDAAGVAASEAHLVVNTHFHSDHTWGNQLFNCPILAHRLCREQMAACLTDDWSVEAIAEYIAEREKSDPLWAQAERERVAGLRITLPTEILEERCDLTIGGVRLQLIHLDAHTPDTLVAWLPEAGVLFASDLIFEGRYPYLFDADVAALIAVLGQLPGFGARSIVPGHGRLCGPTEIAALLEYLERTWARTAEHIAQGHSADEAAADPSYPRYAEKHAERLHQANIRLMYAQLLGQNQEGSA